MKLGTAAIASSSFSAGSQSWEYAAHRARPESHEDLGEMRIVDIARVRRSMAE